MGLKEKFLIILLKAWFYEHVSLLSFLAGGMLTLNYTKTSVEEKSMATCMVFFCIMYVLKFFLFIFGLQKIYQGYHRCRFFSHLSCVGFAEFLESINLGNFLPTSL